MPLRGRMEWGATAMLLEHDRPKESEVLDATLRGVHLFWDSCWTAQASRMND